jgi:arsenate reductase (thioredoxin)
MEESMPKQITQEKAARHEAEAMPGENPARAKAAQGKVELYPELRKYVEAILPEIDQVPVDRKQALKKVALFVGSRLNAGEPANLLFICTHNSRRSHMGQLWAATAAAYYGLAGVKSFSGGTEATAFNLRAVAALERAGFQIDNPGGENPRYKVSFARNAITQEAFSKKYDDAFNPHDHFVAIMTCTEADQNCPVVEGAALRVPIPYVDPKASDGTPEEAGAYDGRARQIGTEMFYLFSQVSAS